MTAIPPGEAASALLGFPVVARSEWGADESLMTWEPEFSPAQAITVHHTAIPNGTEYPTYAEAVRAVYKFHASSENGGRGWGDIGYDLVVDPDGTIYAGRSTGRDSSPVLRPGAQLAPAAPVVTAGHVFGYNPGNIGICLIGNFQTSSPTPAATHSLVAALASLVSKLGLDALGAIRYQSPANSNATTMPTIAGHQDWPAPNAPTECPGTWLEASLPLIRHTVAALGRPARTTAAQS